MGPLVAFRVVREPDESRDLVVVTSPEVIRVERATAGPREGSDFVPTEGYEPLPPAGRLVVLPNLLQGGGQEFLLATGDVVPEAVLRVLLSPGSTSGGAMMQTISQREMRNNSGEVLRRVAAGETLLVTNNGEPAAWLMPVRQSPRERLLATGELQPPAASTSDWGSLPEPGTVAAGAPSVQELLDHERGDR